jgi:PPM family protein phosphatase
MTKILTFTTVNKRDNNEDSCLTFSLNVNDEKYTILLLSDGMGGHDYGEIISNTVISNLAIIISDSILKKSILPQINESDTLNLKKILSGALERTNHKVLQLIQNNKWKGGGATIVAVIIHDNDFFWGTLGDSRLYHIDKTENKLSQIGFDHNVPGILLKEGAITPEIAKHHAQRNQLVYFMGVEKYPDLKNLEFMGEGKIKTNDILYLCSDGLTGKINDEFIQDTFSKYPKIGLSDLNKKIVIENQKLGEKDNQTSIIFVNSDENSSISEEATSTEFNDIIQQELEKEAVESLMKLNNSDLRNYEETETDIQIIKNHDFNNSEIKNLIAEIELKIRDFKESLKTASDQLKQILDENTISPEKWKEIINEIKSQNIELRSLKSLLDSVEEKINKAEITEKTSVELLNKIYESKKFNVKDYREWIEKFSEVKTKSFHNAELNELIKKVESKLALMKKKVEEKENSEIESDESGEILKDKIENAKEKNTDIDAMNDDNGNEKKSDDKKSGRFFGKFKPFKK